jgi:hypothetical protein
VRIDLQHDHVMRWMAFTTSKGAAYEWGFKNHPNTTAVTALPPREGAYLAAFRGYEGKQLPPSLGGYKKRYIIQVGFVWAMPTCSRYEWASDEASSSFEGLVTYGGRATPGAVPPPTAPPAPAIAPVVPLGIEPAPAAQAAPAAPPPAPGAVAGPGSVTLLPGAAVDDPQQVQQAAAAGQVVRAYALMSGRVLEERRADAGRAIPAPAEGPAVVNKLTAPKPSRASTVPAAGP